MRDNKEDFKNKTDRDMIILKGIKMNIAYKGVSQDVKFIKTTINDHRIGCEGEINYPVVTNNRPLTVKKNEECINRMFHFDDIKRKWEHLERGR